MLQLFIDIYTLKVFKILHPVVLILDCKFLPLKRSFYKFFGNYAVTIIKNNIVFDDGNCIVIGASLSEPHTSESNGAIFIYYYYY